MKETQKKANKKTPKQGIRKIQKNKKFSKEDILT
jgi:hypothetical protein